MSCNHLLNFKYLVKRTFLLFLIPVAAFNSGCETRGDKFPQFNVKERLLGTVPKHDINKIFFFNEARGFVVISKDTLLKTTDGCRTFRKILGDSSSVFQDIQFVNDSTGFVLDRKGFIFSTHDAGNSWTKTRIGVSDVLLKDLQCLNMDTLFIAAGTDVQGSDGFIIRSVDAGQTWNSTKTLNLSTVSFLNGSTGYACGRDGIIRTRDSGETWDTISGLASSFILFIDSSEGYCSYKRSVYRTVDGGKNWKLAKTIINPSWIIGEDFSRIECLNVLNDRDLIFTLNARLIKVDAARNWFQYQFTRPYYQLQMISRNQGIVYGFEKLILVDF